tara:strand:- start:280 stop:522 length:243 start_codon:yes stop_codon:yes gene_type:complete
MHITIRRHRILNQIVIVKYSKKNDLSECIDCKQKSILQPQQIAQEEKLKQQIQQEDASYQDQHASLVHARGVTIEWLLYV